MSIQHEAWDAKIAPQIGHYIIEVPNGVSHYIDEIVTSIQTRGFALLSGLGSSKDHERLLAELTQLSASIGTIVAQSPRGEKIEDVRDFSDVDEKDDRGYRSRGELTPHSDPPTIILLHCLNKAKSGGESYIVNVRSIHDRIKDTAPHLLNELYGKFPFWSVEGQGGRKEPGPAPYRRPIFAERDGNVSCVYYRPFIEMAANALNEPLTQLQTEALDLFDYFATSPDLAVRFHLQPDQTMLLQNRAVLHARTDYEDWAEPEKRRHLLRVWIDAPEKFPATAEHEIGDLFKSPV